MSNLLNPKNHSLSGLSFSKIRHHHIFDNSFCIGIWDIPFKPIAHFNSNFSFLFSNKKQNPIVRFLSSYFPRIKDLSCSFFDGSIFKVFQREHCNLRPARMINRSKFLIKNPDSLVIEHLGQIHHWLSKRRNRKAMAHDSPKKQK